MKDDIYDGYVEKKVITTLKSETKLVDEIVSDTISKSWQVGYRVNRSKWLNVASFDFTVNSLKEGKHEKA